MARQVSITVTSATNRVIVMELDGANIISHYETGLGAWALSSGYGTLTGAGDYIKLKSLAGETGEFKFTDISDIEVDGTDVMATATDLRDVVTALAPTMFAGGDAANPLPTGAATSAKQDTQTTEITAVKDRLGALSSPAAGSVNANLQALMKDFAGPFIDLDSETILLWGFFTRSTTTGAMTGIAYFRQDTLASFTPPAGARLLEVESAITFTTMQGYLGTLAVPMEESITQITATGQSAAIDVEGRTGSFVYVFVKNGATNGTIAVHASNDGTNYFSIANTAALTADTIGSLTWSVAYKHVKVDFVMTGAGGTLDGTVYAKM